MCHLVKCVMGPLFDFLSSNSLFHPPKMESAKHQAFWNAPGVPGHHCCRHKLTSHHSWHSWDCPCWRLNVPLFHARAHTLFCPITLDGQPFPAQTWKLGAWSPTYTGVLWDPSHFKCKSLPRCRHDLNELESQGSTDYVPTLQREIYIYIYTCIRHTHIHIYICVYI